MKRTTVWLTDWQAKKLGELAERTELRQAELIRRAIDNLLAGNVFFSDGEPKAEKPRRKKGKN